MKEKKYYFFEWIKKETSLTPSSQLDQKILKKVHALFPSEQKFYNLKKWLNPGVAFALSLTFIFILNNKFHYQLLRNDQLLSLSESPEMILNYKDIELMAAVGNLSEQDWKKIEANQ